MSRLKSEYIFKEEDSKLTSEEKKFLDIWEEYLVQDFYQIDVEPFTHHINNLIHYICAEIFKNQTKTYLRISEKFHYLLMKFYFVHPPDTLKIKHSATLMIFALLFTRLWYSNDFYSPADHLDQILYSLKKQYDDLFSKSDFDQELQLLDSVIESLYNEYITFKSGEHEGDKKSQEEQSINSDLETIYKFIFEAVKKLPRKINSFVLIEKSNDLFTHYANLALLHHNIFYSHLAYSYAIKSYICIEPETSQNSQQFEQQLLVEALCFSITESRNQIEALNNAKYLIESIEHFENHFTPLPNTLRPHQILHFAYCVLTYTRSLPPDKRIAYYKKAIDTKSQINQLKTMPEIDTHVIMFTHFSSFFILLNSITTLDFQQMNELINETIRVLKWEPPENISKKLIEQISLLSHCFQIAIEIGRYQMSHQIKDDNQLIRWLKNSFIGSGMTHDLCLLLHQENYLRKTFTSNIFQIMNLHLMLSKFCSSDQAVIVLSSCSELLGIDISAILDDQSEAKNITTIQQLLELAELFCMILKSSTHPITRNTLLDLLRVIETPIFDSITSENLKLNSVQLVVISVFFYLLAKEFLHFSDDLNCDHTLEAFERFDYYCNKKIGGITPQEYIVQFVEIYQFVATFHEEKHHLSQRISYHEKLALCVLCCDENILPTDAKNQVVQFFLSHPDLITSRLWLKEFNVETPSDPKNPELPTDHSSVYDIEIDADLVKLFEAIERRDHGTVDSLLERDIVHQMHPILGQTATGYAVYQGNLRAFSSLLKKYKKDDAERNNVLSLSLLSVNLNAKSLILDALVMHNQTAHLFSKSNVQAAKGQLLELHEADLDCFYYDVLSDRFNLVNEENVDLVISRFVEDLSDHKNDNYLINKYIKYSRVIPCLIRKLNSAVFFPLIKKLYDHQKKLLNIYTCVHLPPYLFTYFIELENCIADLYFKRLEFKKFEKHIQNSRHLVKQFHQSLSLKQFPLMWFIQLLSISANGGENFISQLRLSDALNDLNMLSNYVSIISTKIHTTVDQSLFSNALLNYMSFIDALIKNFKPELIGENLKDALSILMNAIKVLNLHDSQILRTLSSALLPLWYRGARFFISYTRYSTEQKYSLILNYISQASLIETEKHKAITDENEKFKSENRIKWLCNMLILHYAAYKYFDSVGDRKADDEFKWLNVYLKLISKVDDVPSESLKFLNDLKVIIRLVSAINVTISPSFDYVDTLMTLNKHIKNLEKSIAPLQQTHDFMYVLRIFAINYCRMHTRTDQKVKDLEISTECAFAIGSWVEFKGAHDTSLTNHELIILCDRISWYAMNHTALKANDTYRYAIKLTHLLSERAQGKYLGHFVTTKLIHLHRFAIEYLQECEDKDPLDEIYHYRRQVELLYQDLIEDTEEVPNLTNCKLFATTVSAYLELLNEYEKERFTCYDLFHQFLNKLLEHYDINDIPAEIILLAYVCRISLFSSKKNITDYSETLSLELIFLIRQLTNSKPVCDVTHLMRHFEVAFNAAEHFQTHAQKSKPLALFLLTDAITSYDLLNFFHSNVLQNNWDLVLTAFLGLIHLCVDLKLDKHALEYYRQALKLLYLILSQLIKTPSSISAIEQQRLVIDSKMMLEFISKIQIPAKSQVSFVHPDELKKHFDAWFDQVTPKNEKNTKVLPRILNNLVADLQKKLLLSESNLSPVLFTIKGDLPLSTYIDMKKKLSSFLMSMTDPSDSMELLKTYCSFALLLIKAKSPLTNNLLITIQHEIERRMVNFLLCLEENNNPVRVIDHSHDLLYYYFSLHKHYQSIKDSDDKCSTAIRSMSLILINLELAQANYFLFLNNFSKAQMPAIQQIVQLLKSNIAEFNAVATQHDITLTQIEASLSKKPETSIESSGKKKSASASRATQKGVSTAPEVSLTNISYRREKTPKTTSYIQRLLRNLGSSSSPTEDDGKTTAAKLVPKKSLWYDVELDSSSDKPRNNAYSKQSEFLPSTSLITSTAIDSSLTTENIKQEKLKPTTDEFQQDFHKLLLGCCNGMPQQKLYSNLALQLEARNPHPQSIKNAADLLAHFIETVITDLQISDTANEISAIKFINKYSLARAMDKKDNPKRGVVMTLGLPHEELVQLFVRAAKFVNQQHTMFSKSVPEIALEFLNKYSFQFESPIQNRKIICSNFSTLFLRIEDEDKEVKDVKESLPKQLITPFPSAAFFHPMHPLPVMPYYNPFVHPLMSPLSFHPALLPLPYGPQKPQTTHQENISIIKK